MSVSWENELKVKSFSPQQPLTECFSKYSYMTEKEKPQILHYFLNIHNFMYFSEHHFVTRYLWSWWPRWCSGWSSSRRLWTCQDPGLAEEEETEDIIKKKKKMSLLYHVHWQPMNQSYKSEDAASVNPESLISLQLYKQSLLQTRANLLS